MVMPRHHLGEAHSVTLKTGPDWLMILLSSLDVDEELKAKMLLFWRLWHMRNDVIHAT
jgi:hypothetical protein